MAVYQTQAQQDFFKNLLKEVYKANEAPASKWYVFSDAEGNSGYSFGQPQWDVKTSGIDTENFLKSIGFTQPDIDKLQKDPGTVMTGSDRTRMNNLLALNKSQVDNFSRQNSMPTSNSSKTSSPNSGRAMRKTRPLPGKLRATPAYRCCWSITTINSICKA